MKKKLAIVGAGLVATLVVGSVVKGVIEGELKGERIKRIRDATLDKVESKIMDRIKKTPAGYSKVTEE